MIFILMLFLLLGKVSALPFSVEIEKHRLTLSWNYNDAIIAFEVRARVTPRSWMAVGASDYGDFASADFCVLWTDLWGRQHVTDTYTDSKEIMRVDQQQDCQLQSVNQTQYETVWRFVRPRTSCDKNDYQYEEGTTHLLALIGPGHIRSVDGLNIKDNKKKLYKSMLRMSMFPPYPAPADDETDIAGMRDVQIMEVLSDRVKVPARETTYWCVIKKLPHLNTKHHIIQYESAIQEGNEDLVHHIEVFHCEIPTGIHISEWEGDCDDGSAPKDMDYCKRVIGAWAMGAPPLRYPPEAGYPIGGREFSPYVRIEMHYNNPEETAGRIDSSGIRFYYTTQLRPFDAGCIELGLEYTPKMAIPPRMDHFQLSGNCIAGCTEKGVPPDGINVFASQLHTHLTGMRVWTRHFRDGVELPELDRDNHYNTMFQEIRKLKKPVVILPGDELLTTCEFRTLDRSNATLGGYAISDEMCVNYIHYYPRTNLEVCKSSIDTDALMTFFEHMRTLDDDDTAPEKSVNENYHSIRWTPLTASVLRDLYAETPLSMQCNMSSGHRFPGNWNNAPQVRVAVPLPPKTDACGRILNQ
ncbi:dopamine beta-hydroxylase-like [Paramacrobiotus metropolitanus]|uniref:dopamine beta-hydroxylase-like n=1 Tax=Paramacrobiotus metropolitanus TaxID=2943436 RepID=UPI002445C2FD|nr:dopamine beta-hydroxylase-like [Paramacrobiotus metropolitanus]